MPQEINVRRRILIISYLGFVSLGLPDTVLGVAWPEMRMDLGAPLSWAGILISLTTVISFGASLASVKIMKKFSTGCILASCALTTALAMLGYALAPTLAVIAGFTLLFGIGQGAVDTAVNAHMARHYSSRHMNWVHGFWGMGAPAGPLIFAAAFGLASGWRSGYFCLFAIQLSMALIFFATLKWWRLPLKEECRTEGEKLEEAAGAASLRRSAFGVLFYFCYPGLEVVTGLWGASYLIEVNQLTPQEAGSALALYWGSLTLGRFAMGWLAGRFSNSALIRAGLMLVSACVLTAYLSPWPFLIIPALGLMGLGLSTLYPSMMHETPRRCGPERLDKIISYQVGAAMAGAAVLPALAGLYLRQAGLVRFPFLLIIMTLALIMVHELSAAKKKS